MVWCPSNTHLCPAVCPDWDLGAAEAQIGAETPPVPPPDLMAVTAGGVSSSPVLSGLSSAHLSAFHPLPSPVCPVLSFLAVLWWFWRCPSLGGALQVFLSQQFCCRWISGEAPEEGKFRAHSGLMLSVSTAEPALTLALFCDL